MYVETVRKNVVIGRRNEETGRKFGNRQNIREEPGRKK